MKIQLLDLDGCISDDRWRRGFIMPRPADGSNPPERFRVYHNNGWQDHTANLGRVLPGTQIVVLTARPVLYRHQTLHWLNQAAGISPLYVIHRNNDDHRPSVEVKRDQLKWLLDPNSYGIALTDIVAAFDDLDAIVKMYREEFGIVGAEVLRIGEEEHIA